MSTDPDSDEYSVVEDLWEGAAKVMQIDPALVWEKTMFVAGMKAALVAMDTVLAEEDPPVTAEDFLDEMCDECDEFCHAMRLDLEARRAGPVS